MVASNLDLSLQFWLLSPMPEVFLRRSNVSLYWLKQGLSGWGRICQMLDYFVPNSWQGKENGPKQNEVRFHLQRHFLGLPLPDLVPAVLMFLCPPKGSISLFHHLRCVSVSK